VFHTNAGHVTRRDEAYNGDRNAMTGNPYRNPISDLQKQGVQVAMRVFSRIDGAGVAREGDA
jgi:hypothetical protein